MQITNLYETDFYAWTQRQSTLLRQEEFEAVDWNNLIEEIETLGRSEQNELESRLQVLIMHLLKWQLQADKRSPSWETTIMIQRIDLARLLRKNPSLRARLAEFVTDAYPDAVKKAIAETRLPKEHFPVTCPYPVAAILDDAFWPD